MTSADVIAALRTRFAPPEWYLMTEVANGTGYSGKKRETYADAVLLNAYQSGDYGAEFHLVEVKVSKQDLKHEREDEGKAEEVGKFCHRRWLAVPAPHYRIVTAEDMLPGWGLLEATEAEVRTVIKAPRADPKKAPTMAFIAALVRRASEERADKEALKGALLKAPMRQVAYRWRDSLVLTCGHVLADHARWGRTPKSARCLPCADGQPPHRDLLAQSMGALTSDELREVARRATADAVHLDAQAAQGFDRSTGRYALAQR